MISSLLCALAVSLATPEDVAVRERVPGTRVKLVRPVGFVPAPTFCGYQAEESGASVVVSELPAPFEELAAGYTPQALAARGMTLVERRELLVGGRAGHLLELRQALGDIEFGKWILLLGNRKVSVMIVAAYPMEHETAVREPLRNCLQSAMWNPQLEIDPFADLGFAIDAPAGFRLASRMGKTLLFTRDGKPVQEDPAEPLFLAGLGLGAAPFAPDEIQQFAEQRLAETEGVGALEIERSAAFEVAGLNGWGITARESGGVAASRQFVCQWILLREDGWAMIQGHGTAAEAAELEAAFEAAAKSWRELAPSPAEGR